MVTPNFIVKTIYAKVGRLSGGMQSQYNRPKGFRDPAAARRRSAEAQVKLWEKQRAEEEEKEMQRHKLAALKEEQLKKGTATSIEAEQEKMMDAKTLPRVGIITSRSEIEQKLGDFEHEDLWKAICMRVSSDSDIKEVMMNAITDEAMK